MIALMPRVMHLNLAKGWRGGEQQTWLLMKSLADHGCRQGLLARADEPLASQARALPNLELLPYPQYLFRRAAAENFDLAHVHEARAVYLAWWLHKRKGLPYLVTRRMQQSPKARFLTRQAYGEADRLVGISSAACRGLEYLLPNALVQRVPSVHSGVMPNKLRSQTIRQNILTDPEAILVGHAGALIDSHKGQTLLIEAARRLRHLGYNIEVVFFGEGRDGAMLKQSTSDNPWIHWEGQVVPIQDYLGALDIFAFPSRHEGLGSVLIDVMLAGIPIVAADVGGIPDIIYDGVSGLLTYPNDSQDLERALKALLNDPETRKKLSAAGKERATSLSPEAMMKRYIEIYGEVLSASASRVAR